MSDNSADRPTDDVCVTHPGGGVSAETTAIVDMAMDDEELSEEEDDDFITDTIGYGHRLHDHEHVDDHAAAESADFGDSTEESRHFVPRSSLHPVSDNTHTRDGDGGGGEDEEDTTGSSAAAMPVLLEGDYFPSIPASVLAELRALDDEDDAEERRRELFGERKPSNASLQSPQISSSTPGEIAAATAVEGSAAAEGTMLSPRVLPSIDLSLLHDSATFHPVRLSPSPPHDHGGDAHSSTTTAANRQLSSSPRQARAPSSPGTGVTPTPWQSIDAQLSQPAMSPSPLQAHIVTVAAAPPRGDSVPSRRKRVRWVDEVPVVHAKSKASGASRSLVHHASSFTIPGHWLPQPSQSASSSAALRSSSSAASRRSAAAEHQLLNASVQVFREVVNNEDRSRYYACRPQRPSLVFSQWRRVALNAEEQPRQTLSDHDEPLEDMTPPVPVPNMFASVVHDIRSGNPGASPSWAATPSQVYRTLFPDARPLFGTIKLQPNERFATRMLTLTLPSSTSAPTSDSNGTIQQAYLNGDNLMVPPMWAGTLIPADQYPTLCCTASEGGGEQEPSAAGDEVRRSPPAFDAPLRMPW